MKATRTIPGIILGLLFALAQSGCGPQSNPGSDHGHDHSAGDGHGHAVKAAVAQLQPTEGNETNGKVTFTKVENGIQVVVDIQGFQGGAGKRGFHIHENGDCSAPDGTSAGGHFNPEEKAHGAPDAAERHAGDFGNLTVDDEGNARTDFVDSTISFDGPNSIIGRAVIVHAQEDDLQTQPTGDAGARVACGVIQAVEYEN